MKYLVISFCLLWKPAFSQVAGDSSFSLVWTYSGDVADAAIDHLDYLYVISSTGQVRKFGPAGDSAGIYNQVRNYGKLHSVDVSNPLRPLLFYRDFSSIVLLDRFLSSRAVIDLRRHGILQPGAAGQSYDNNIWVFDEWDSKVKKIDEQGRLLLETNDLRQVFSETIRPQRIIDHNGLVYLADPVHGIYVFDSYGAFKKKLPPTGWQGLTVKDNYLIHTQPGQIIVYNTSTHMDVKKQVPPAFQPYVMSFSTTNRLVTYSARDLRIYHYRF